MSGAGHHPLSTTPLHDATDADLVARCRAGEQAAWNALVRRYQSLVYTVPRRAGLPEAAAADVFQTCFTRLFENLDRLDDGSRVRAWLVTTAKRESLRLLELAQRHVDMPGSAAGDDGDADTPDPMQQLADPNLLPDELLDTLQQHHRLQQALQQLDARSRLLLELLFLQDETPSYAEIARRTGLAEGSIGPNRARCLARLRAILAQS